MQFHPDSLKYTGHIFLANLIWNDYPISTTLYFLFYFTLLMIWLTPASCVKLSKYLEARQWLHCLRTFHDVAHICAFAILWNLREQAAAVVLLQQNGDTGWFDFLFAFSCAFHSTCCHQLTKKNHQDGFLIIGVCPLAALSLWFDWSMDYIKAIMVGKHHNL